MGRVDPLEYAQRIAYSSVETLRFTYEMAKRFNKTNAIFIECGVAAGAQIIAMKHGAPNALIFAYDSFEGIPLPSNRDNQMPGIAMLTKAEQKALPDPGQQVLMTSGATIVSIFDLLDHITSSGVDSAGIVPIKGWFETTIPEYNGFPISLLRLDADLYNSTWVCLQYLFPHVIKGGCVIIDDWELPGCRDACTEYFNLIGYTPEYQSVSNIKYFFK